MKKTIFLSLMLSASLSFAFGQKSKKPAASPHQTVIQNFDLSTITIDYSRPGVKGRKIFGGLVPFDKEWRTGANAVTTVDFGKEVMLNGHAVKAGKYALYTIPGENSWTIILNKDVKNWGTKYSESDDVLRFQANPQKINFKFETFTINIDEIRDNSAVLYLAWDHTYVPIKVTAK